MWLLILNLFYLYGVSITLSVGAAHCRIRLFASVWRVARRFLIFVFFPSIYVLCNGLGADMKYCSRGIVRVEVVCSSLVKYFFVSDVF